MQKKSWYSFSRKKVGVPYRNLGLKQKSNLISSFFLSGQGIVQITPHLVWSIPVYAEFKTNQKISRAWLGKKTRFLNSNFRMTNLRLDFFKNRVKELFKLQKTWHEFYPVYVEFKKRTFAIRCLGKR